MLDVIQWYPDFAHYTVHRDTIYHQISTQYVTSSLTQTTIIRAVRNIEIQTHDHVFSDYFMIQMQITSKRGAVAHIDDTIKLMHFSP